MGKILTVLLTLFLTLDLFARETHSVRASKEELKKMAKQDYDKALSLRKQTEKAYEQAQKNKKNKQNAENKQ